MLVNLLKLELLDLSECEQITDATIKAIVFNCRLLRSLNVSGCTRVSCHPFHIGFFICNNAFLVNRCFCQVPARLCIFVSAQLFFLKYNVRMLSPWLFVLHPFV